MKAFVSYSFNDVELYIITLLFEQLGKSGYQVESSFESSNFHKKNISISQANIFLGIITNNSESVDHVIHEWNIAKNNNISNILLIEDGVNVTDPNIKFIRFNRLTPRNAINQLFNINTLPAKTIKKQEDKTLENVVVGAGILVGLAALISLLSGSGKKK